MTSATKDKQLSAPSWYSLLYLAAVIASLSGLLFGYDTGVVSGALLFLKTQYHLSPTMQEVVIGVLMIITAAVFLLGVLVTAFAPGIAVLIVGRVIVGVGIGVASYLGPLYICEISPAAMRGNLVALNHLLLTLGILISYFVDYGLSASGDWRWMFGLAVVPALALGVGMIFLPESPRWLLQQGRTDEAAQALKRLDGSGQVQAEIAGIRRDLGKQGKSGGWADLVAPSLRPALLVGLALAAFDQLTGINTIIFRRFGMHALSAPANSTSVKSS